MEDTLQRGKRDRERVVCVRERRERERERAEDDDDDDRKSGILCVVSVAAPSTVGYSIILPPGGWVYKYGTVPSCGTSVLAAYYLYGSKGALSGRYLLALAYSRVVYGTVLHTTHHTISQYQVLCNPTCMTFSVTSTKSTVVRCTVL